MVRIYKNLMREVVDNHKNGAKDEISKSLAESGVIDFVAFQKAIIRIAAVSQEKLDKLAMGLDITSQAEELNSEKKKQLMAKAKNQH